MSQEKKIWIIDFSDTASIESKAKKVLVLSAAIQTIQIDK